ncbi:glycosyltransferase [Fischerella thermalis]|nr:glycosyltransferase [Fischerella thermalis]PLZ76267.1 hypothetical protein CBP16_22605 [Fischerella thermalis WC217]PLZ20336.1 hypothetical protein CBP19_00120 [Fischerella thermalis WC1110]PLZ41703.1 hypothetical protein CBP25_16635 [Fischerella thermalis WC527]PLZ43014.1 hypothetical protein CBP26_06180 [Fischerella thermalis WC538]PLZ54195.1 hypothetical protein CBP13_07340 [Fischerella thermalis WC441]
MTNNKTLLESETNRAIRIQFVSREIPVENLIGSSTYILDFISYLCQKDYEIEYILLNYSPNGEIPWYIIPPSIAALTNIVAKNNLRIGRILLRFNSLSDWLTALLRPVYNLLLPEKLKDIYRFTRDRKGKTYNEAKPNIPQFWGTPATAEEMAFANSRFVKFKPDVVIANYAFLGSILDSPFLDKTVLKVILTHDVLSQRVVDYQKLGIPSCLMEYNKETEAIELCKAQVLLAIQEEDAKVFQEIAPQCEVISMPMSAVPHSHTVKQVPGRCLFVGSATDHNVYGLQWFLKYVWPLVLESVPHCSLHVCGTVCNGFEEAFPNVRFLGRVNDLEPEYSNAEVCLIPLIIGSGLKIKLVEAMSYGRACVSTSVGVQGLGEIIGSAVLVADTIEDFAAAIRMLLTNLDKRQWMEEQAHKYVTEKLSPKAVYQPFVDKIEQHLQQLATGMLE